MISSLKVYISNSFDVYENLAIEKLLFDNVEKNCVILYLWQNENTVVIGQNQNPWNECNCRFLEEDGGHLARRLSGGGCVFHDKGNLNFTFICYSENYDVTRQLKVIQGACALAGIETQISGRNDIIADSRKFSGNAFYNSQGKSYHHGTVMVNTNFEKMKRYLTPSEKKLNAKGVKSVQSRVVNLTEFCPDLTCEMMKEYMISSFEDIYGMKTEPTSVDKKEIALLRELYSSTDYLYKKTPPFSLTVKDRFLWGEIEMHLDVKEGVIKNVLVYTDALDWKLPEKIKASLIGCSFKREALKKALPSNIAEDISGLFEF